MAGFGYVTFGQIDLTGLDPWSRFSIYIFATVSLSAALLCVCHATYVTIWGPSLALRGKSSTDMERALIGMQVLFFAHLSSTFHLPFYLF